MKVPMTVFALALLLAAGCVSYEYKGEKGGEPTESVAVFMNSGSRPIRRHRTAMRRLAQSASR